MEGRQCRSFTDDYKRQAVDLVASSGRSIGSVAKESYALRALAQSVHALDDPLEFTKEIWGRTARSRASKLLAMTVNAGFHRVTSAKLPNGARAIADETWLRLANMNRFEFLDEMRSRSEAETAAIAPSG
jgi:hypothetical protein